MATKRVRAEIDLDAILYNMNQMHQNIDPKTKIVAVIKTNAYGHGATEIAKTVEPLPFVWGYAVATVDEALELLREGMKKNILVLGICFDDQYEEIVKNGIRVAVCDYNLAKQLSEIARKNNQICKIHIKIDTGMSRIGFPAKEESIDVIQQISELPNLEIEGVFTHFARADEISKKPAEEQLNLFLHMINQIHSRGIKIPLKHCSNSAGIVEIPEANLDMVRAGITLYGLWPSEEINKNKISLSPVMALKSQITFLKDLEKGQSISYGGTYVTDSAKKIATIPVGYGDGYSRSLSNKGYVLIHGKRAPICGRVCMDQFMVDVTDIDNVCVGDEVTLLGKDGDLEITMEELGRLSGRFNYEFACLISPRVPRVFLQKEK